MENMKVATTIVTLVLLFLSCVEQEDLSQQRDDRDFFPLAIGNYWEYTVLERNYDAQGANERNYFLREVVEDTIKFEDLTTGYLIRRYTRDSVKGIWQKESIYTVQQTTANMTINQDGLTTVKQVYPVAQALSWDPNVKNNLGKDEYSYSYSKSDTTINDSTYINTVRLILDPLTENLTQELSRFEIYGKGVGLLVKDYTSLNFNTIQGDPNEGEIESGTELKQYITTYGQ